MILNTTHTSNHPASNPTHNRHRRRNNVANTAAKPKLHQMQLRKMRVSRVHGTWLQILRQSLDLLTGVRVIGARKDYTSTSYWNESEYGCDRSSAKCYVKRPRRLEGRKHGCGRGSHEVVGWTWRVSIRSTEELAKERFHCSTLWEIMVRDRQADRFDRKASAFRDVTINKSNATAMKDEAISIVVTLEGRVLIGARNTTK